MNPAVVLLICIIVILIVVFSTRHCKMSCCSSKDHYSFSKLGRGHEGMMTQSEMDELANMSPQQMVDEVHSDVQKLLSTDKVSTRDAEEMKEMVKDMKASAKNLESMPVSQRRQMIQDMENMLHKAQTKLDQGVDLVSSSADKLMNLFKTESFDLEDLDVESYNYYGYGYPRYRRRWWRRYNNPYLYYYYAPYWSYYNYPYSYYW